MLIAAGAAILLLGGGIAVALTLGGSPQTAQPDQASVQLAEAEKKRAAELEQKLAEEAESRKKLEAQVAESEAKREAEDKKRSEERRTLVGSGDRSQRIRTYNFPDNRVTDHRIGLTLYKLDQIIAGNLQPVTDALIEHDRNELRDQMGVLE